MGSDAKRLLAAAEKLLKQGKVDEAIKSFDRVVDEAQGDLLTVNRVGDAVVAAGHPEKAVPYYGRIADQFARQGFFPKAIAIRKKILRLMPDAVEPLVALGDLYVRQEHPGEARSHYLRAADRLLSDKDFDAAREVYERLVQAEPDDARHRVRLAETRAAGGDDPGAAADLIVLGQRLLQSGKPEDAEKAFSRAGELDSSRHEVVQGRIHCLTETGRDDEALELLEAEVAKPDSAIELSAELLVLYEVNGRTESSDQLLAGERAHEFPLETYSTVVQFHDRKGGLDALWPRIEAILDAWFSDGRREQATRLLEALSGWTEAAFPQPLEYRLKKADEASDEALQVELLDRLVESYRSADRADDADAARKRLIELRPDAEVDQEQETPAAGATATEAPAGSEAATGPLVDVPVEYEAPAVPLSRADEEFVAGRMTQAEILEKYGLLSQAVDQLYEVVERYPGHLEANQRLVTLQRGSAQDSILAQALVKLGLARRAAGRVDVARQSVAEADKLGGVDASMRGILVALDLLDGEPAAAPKAAPVAASAPAREVTPAETVIDFDSFDDEGDEEADDAAVDAAIDAVAEPAKPAVEAETSAAPGTAEPGVSSVPKFDETPAVLARGTGDAMRFEPLPALDQDQDDADLAALAAALDEDLLGEDSLDEAPASESEESLDEVFAAFRERVDEEVGAQDYRTHYDLGIGYKEMGLLDAAIAEFEISVKGEDLVQESCVMLALCFRDRAEHVRAAEWYRQAVDALGQDPADTCGLRYDLAETLLEAGETQEAADLFRDVERLDPGFRDVTRRLADLAHAGSD